MDFKIIHIEETDSTNRWLKENGKGEMVAVADYQTAGKGCGTNTWESERGKNLTFSLLIHPTEIHASRQFLISEAVSVALCTMLANHFDSPAPLSIKWPNDIYYGDRKICGILIENMLQGSTIKDSIIGIGINVNQEIFRSDAPNPVSMYQILGCKTDRETLLQEFLDQLSIAFESKDTPLTYRRMLFRRDGYYTYKDAKGPFKAKLLDVLLGGSLVLLDTKGAARYYAFKEVEFVI